MAPRRRRGAGPDAGDDAQSETDAPKNRPPNTAFRQQRMRAWQCVLTPKLIVTIFSILAAIYLGFGAWLTYLAHTVCRSALGFSPCVERMLTAACCAARSGTFRSTTPTARRKPQKNSGQCL